MTRRAAAILLAVLAVAVAALLWISSPVTTTSSSRRRFRLFRVTPVPVGGSSVTPAAGAPPPTSGPTVRVTLFFPGSEDGKLRSEERDIAKPVGGNAFLKALFAELKRGPQRSGLLAPLPEKIQLRNAFLLSPHLASARQEVPDLLDGPVCNGNRCLPGTELKMRHSPSGKTQKDSNIGSIWSDPGSLDRQPHRNKRFHRQTSAI